MTRLMTFGFTGLLAIWPGMAGAQPQALPRPEGFVVVQQANASLDVSDARRVRAELQQMLMQHPPSLRLALQADPSLLERADYLSAYPRVAEYLKAHPEILRDPRYFVGGTDGGWYRERSPSERALESLEMVLLGLAFFSGFMAVLFVFGSLIRQAIAQRRWSRMSRIQTEVHTKILERLHSNDELLAYIQTPAGQRFLQSGPSPMTDTEPRAVAAPFGRILWSVQAGVMLVALGIGFWFVQRSAMAEIAPAFNAMGVIATALGLGAIGSGVVSYLLSMRFGLLKPGE